MCWIVFFSTTNYEWMTDYLSLFICVSIQGRNYLWSVMFMTRFTRVTPWMYAYDSLYIDNWRIINFLKCLPPKIVLPHRCQILRLVNKTSNQSTVPTGSEHVVGPSNAPYKLTRTVYWMQNTHLTFQSSNYRAWLPIFWDVCACVLYCYWSSCQVFC